MTFFQQGLSLLTRQLGELVNEDAVDVAIEYHMLPKRPHVSYELTEEGSRVRTLIEQFVISQISEYAQREHVPITMKVEFTNQPEYRSALEQEWDAGYDRAVCHQDMYDTEFGKALRENPHRKHKQ